MTLLSVLLPSGSRAQEPAATEDALTAVDPELPARLHALEQSHRLLERKLELEKEKAAEAAKAVPLITAGEKGFILRSPEGAFQLRLRGLLQVDGRGYPADDQQPLTDTFLVRRVRPILEATVLDLIDLKLAPDFGEGKVLLYDAYAEVRPWPWLKLRAGKFKPALGLERLQSAGSLTFIERAAPTALVPNRDLGLQLHGEGVKGAVTYALGVFNGVPDGTLGDGDTNENKELLGRLFLHPFRFFELALLEKFGVGMAATFGRQTGTVTSPQVPSFKSAGQQTFFTYLSDAYANGNRTRVSPQAYLYLGPVGVMAEFVSSSQTFTRAGKSTALTNSAWQTAVSWVMTGDKASYEGVVPDHSFSFAHGHLGALELALRYQVLRVDDSAFPSYADTTKSARRATSFGAGLNWYLSRNAKVNLDCERTYFIGGAAKGADRPAENALIGRLQVAF